MTPLIEKVTIDIYAVRLTQVLGDQCTNGWQILLLEAMFVLDVSQLARQFCQTCCRLHLNMSVKTTKLE
jgi:hypothetical protein